MKSVIRILIGVVLLYSAHWLHVASHQYSDKVIGIEPPEPEKKPEPNTTAPPVMTFYGKGEFGTRRVLYPR